MILNCVQSQLRLVLQDEVVELFFSYLDSNLKLLKDTLYDKSNDNAETLLEDLYCASSVLGFNLIANRAKDLRGLVTSNSSQKIRAQSEFFFLKCEAQMAWTEWYCHRSTVERAACQSTMLEDSLQVPRPSALSEESIFRFDGGFQ